MTSVTEVKHKWLWSVPEEMQVPAKCLTSARKPKSHFYRLNEIK